MSRDYSSVLPASVSVWFKSRRCSGLVTDTVPDSYVSTVSISGAGWTGASGGFTGFQGAKIFKDYALALFDVGNPNPTNQSILDTLAGQIAQDFYNWNSLGFDIAYDGIAAPDPNGLLDEITWDHTLEGAKTRIQTAPYNGEPEQLLHSDGASNSGCADNLSSTPQLITTKEPCVEMRVPPATRSGSTISWPIMKFCIEDGILTETYVRTETTCWSCIVYCHGDGSICALVSSCGVAAPGVSITVVENSTPPVTTGTGTTDSTGKYCVSIPQVDSYTVTAVGPCQMQSQTIAGECGMENDVAFFLTGPSLSVNFSADCPTSGPFTGGGTVTISGFGFTQTGNVVGIPSGTGFGCLPAFGTYSLSYSGDNCYNAVSTSYDVETCSASTTIATTAKTYDFSGIVAGCDAPTGQPGFTVNISGDAGAYTGTTDSGGNYGPAVLKANCTFTISISKSRYTTITQNLTAGCADDTTADYTLGAAPGYQCVACCDDPIFSSLQVTDSQGSHPLNFVSGGGGGWQTDCIPSPNVPCGCTVGVFTGCDGTTYQAPSVYFYQLSCIGGRQWQLIRAWPSCSHGSPPSFYPVAASCSPGNPPVFGGQPGTCSFGALAGGASLGGYGFFETVTGGPVTCGPLNITFPAFNFGFTDTATVDEV